MRHIILGTAGHIDHGKSSLVKALTGIDPDRLKEEKERGITIDIGFADLDYPEIGLQVGIVDVPGHEKLISNMLAGAGGIDIVLMVIAADEGIMPQSREHLAICDLLKIKSGLIAITKSDLVEKDWLELVSDEIREFAKNTFLERSPVIPVSSRTGHNIDLLKKEIRDISMSVNLKSSEGLFRLPIDRVFTLKGFGTVITGTAVSGKISVDEPVEILPRGLQTKVRGLHCYGKQTNTAFAGQRVAINLQGIEKEDIKRGDVATNPDCLTPTKAIDTSIELLKDSPLLKSRSLVHFFTGTSEAVARIVVYGQDEIRPGESCFCQFRLQEPIVAMSSDRFIIRRFSPLETLGGGEILDTSPTRRRRRDSLDDLKIFLDGSLAEKIALKVSKAGIKGITENSLKGWINPDNKDLSAATKTLKQSNEIVQHEGLILHKASLEKIRHAIIENLKAFHKANPLKSGMPKEEMRGLAKVDNRLFNFIISGMQDITAEKDLLRLSSFKPAFSGIDSAGKDSILSLLEKGGFQPPLKNELAEALKTDQKRLNDILGLLVREGSVVKINDSIYLSRAAHQNMLEILKGFFLKKPELTVAEFRDLLNTSRKYALPFLEHLDSGKITLRTGDTRKLLGKI